MCGRFANSEDPAVQAAYFLAKLVAKNWQPTWNAAPTQLQPVVFEEGGERRLELMSWGWRRERSGSQVLVNARGEEAAGKRTWSTALRERRCLVPITAFYEWRQSDRQPYAFALASRALVGVAALWEQVGDVRAFVLLTVPANRLVAPVHHRMACLLPRTGEAAWLAEGTATEHVAALITPYPAEGMVSFPVSRAVNQVQADAPELLEPVTVAEQEWLFPPAGGEPL